MNTLKQYGRLIAGVLIILFIIAICWAVVHYGNTRYAAGVDAGRNAVLADDARQVAQVQEARNALDSLSASAGQQLQHNLGTALPAIQAQTHDTIETIRTVYRDRPAAAVNCSRPDGVQSALDQAVDRANAAAGAPSDVRSDTAPAAAGSSAAPPVGGGHPGE
ncbi:hypothetical protein [Dyella japonica]|uniref:Uncharacterized protein n=1 Tax=Dyella japonica TaxID=231455 RepID=A0ABV2JXF3_9GAMM